jgi:Family of unknown function (DUF6518)
MVVVLALVLAAAFGAGDQYLGSLVSHPWGADVASLSAPWLVLAFLAGATQREPRRAVLVGLGCTYAALAGYLLLTDSPLEGAHYSVANLRGFLVSNIAVVAGGLLTGPLFGWFGQRWRTRRALLGALASAAALCLEPLARRAPLGTVHSLGHDYLVTSPIDSRLVVAGEVAAGLALAVYVLVVRAVGRAVRA